MMPCAGLLALLIILIAFNLMQAKHFILETEDNSEANQWMPKEEVDAVLQGTYSCLR